MNNFQEQFYQMMTRLRANSRSRAASTQDSSITEISEGLIVSKPVKKEPEIIDLQEYAKSRAASSVPAGINKLKAITDFINSNGRI
jgi:hypothetical protein